jgi:hypothetical protein
MRKAIANDKRLRAKKVVLAYGTLRERKWRNIVTWLDCSRESRSDGQASFRWLIQVESTSFRTLLQDTYINVYQKNQ